MALMGPGGLGFKLNVLQGGVFLVLFVVVLFFTAGLLMVAVSFVVSAAAAVGLYHFVFNKTLPVPDNGAVLITGTSSGMGRAAALQLAADGYLVFATVRKEADAAGLTAPKGAKGRIVPLICDICDVDSLVEARAIVERECETGGKDLQGIVNNAGYAEYGPLEILPLEALRRQLNTNVVGQVAVSQVFLPLLRSRKRGSSSLTSRVVFVSSMVGRFTAANLAAYCASKQALEAVADGFRMELRKWNIDVSVIQPGATETPYHDRKHDTLAANGIDRSSEGLFCTEETALVYREKAAAAPPKQKKFPVEHVTHAITAALRDSRPLARYRCTPDAEILVPLLNILPDAVRDRMFSGAYK